MKPHTRTLAWGATAALYFVVTTWAHLAFSLWLVAPRTATWQGQTFAYSYRDAMPWLLAKTLDTHRSHWPVGWLLLLTTLLGATDELIQYLWITASYSHYYDFNDVLVNLLAAVLGVMVYYGFRVPPRANGHRKPAGAALALVLLGLLLVLPVAATQRVHLTPSQAIPPGGLAPAADGRLHLYLQRQPGMYDRWHSGAWRSRHWVLGPLAATTALALVWLAWWPFGHLGNVTAGQARRYDAAGPHPTL